MRHSAGAFLLHRAGHCDACYGLDADRRPYLLNLNSADKAAHRAAIAWLEGKAANPTPASFGKDPLSGRGRL